MASSAPQVLSPLVGGPAEQAAAAKERGTKAFRAKDFAGAVKGYSEALAINPEDHALLSNRSAAYGSLEKFKEAWQDAKECVRLRPDWPKGYARLGFGLVHLFRLEEAQKAYQDGLNLEPDKDVEKTLRAGLEDVAAKLDKETNAEAEAEQGEKDAKASKRRAGLNHKPAWQSRGLGVNKEIFGETTGDLVKPGMTKADFERIKNSVAEGPDPFGDVFREAASETTSRRVLTGAAKRKKNRKAAAGGLGQVLNLMSALNTDEANLAGSTEAEVDRICDEALTDLDRIKDGGAVGRLHNIADAVRMPGGELDNLLGLMGALSSTQGKAPSPAVMSKAVAVRTSKALATAPWRIWRGAPIPAKAPPSFAKSGSAAVRQGSGEAWADEEEYDPFSTAPEDGQAPPVKAPGPWKTKAPPVKAPPHKAPPTKGAPPIKVKAPPERGMSKSATKMYRQNVAGTGASMKAFAKGKAPPRRFVRPPPPPPPGTQARVVPPLRGQPAKAFSREAMTPQQIEALRSLLKEKVARSFGPEGVLKMQESAADFAPARPIKRQRPPPRPEDAADAAAASWLQRGGPTRKSSTSRVDKAAALAQEHFCPTDKKEEPDAKKQKTAAKSFTFASEILNKTPDNVQTIRSLQLFLEKKLSGEVATAPEVGGPQDLRSRVEAHANKLGRLAALRATSGWDARAKRILDIAGAVKTAGGAALDTAEKTVEKAKPELEGLLKEHGGLDSCVEKRVAWVKDSLKRDWLTWCSRLLHSREAALTKDGEGDKAPAASADQAGALSYVAIIEALLAGEGAPSKS